MLVSVLVSLLSLPGYVLSYQAPRNASARTSLNTQSYELSVSGAKKLSVGEL